MKTATAMAPAWGHWGVVRRPIPLIFLGILVLGPTLGELGWAQGPPLRLLEPQQVTMTTKDMVEIQGTFYPSKAGKQAVPLLALHGWKGNRGRFDAFARSMQQRGHAVLTIDLRGHGASTRRRNGQRIDVDRMSRREMSNLWLDVEAAKQYLMQKNNDGQINIDLLCLIAEDVSCIVALEWSVRDWNAPPLPTMKQGQDVKALVLLSPIQTFRGITAQPVFRSKSRGAVAVRSRLSVMLIAGKDDESEYAEASRMHTSFRRFRGETPKESKDQELVFYAPSTSLQGTKLLSARVVGGKVVANIGKFIDYRVVGLKERFPWQDRRNPLSR